MNKRVKLAIAALLGFSAACSSVKNAPKQGDEQIRLWRWSSPTGLPVSW